MWIAHICYSDLQLVSVMKVFITLTGALNFYLGANSVTEEPRTVPLSLQISQGSSFSSSKHLADFYHLLFPSSL